MVIKEKKKKRKIERKFPFNCPSKILKKISETRNP